MAALLIALSQTVHIAQLLDNRFFNWIAKLSFGVYLWHVLLIEIIARKFERSFVYYGVGGFWFWSFIASIVVIASFAIASISWRYMESPLLAKARRGEVKQY
jgi:peptidoglycan/LPS O-acetylase OafA/YrhL